MLNISEDLFRLGIASTNMVPNQPSLDAGPLFFQAVLYAQNHNIGVVIADPGSYYFLSLQSPQVHIAWDKLSNLTIDLQGSDLYFTHPLVDGSLLQTPQTWSSRISPRTRPPCPSHKSCSATVHASRYNTESDSAFTDNCTLFLHEPARGSSFIPVSVRALLDLTTGPLSYDTLPGGRRGVKHSQLHQVVIRFPAAMNSPGFRRCSGRGRSRRSQRAAIRRDVPCSRTDVKTMKKTILKCKSAFGSPG